MKIGSIHGRLNYKLEERAFSKEDYHESNRQKKIEAKRWARKDVLGLEKPEWDFSVGPQDVSTVRRQRQISQHDPTLYKYNYRAEVLPKPSDKFVPRCGRQNFDQRRLHKELRKEHTKIVPSKRISEMPVHPALENKMSWDNSTTINRNKLDQHSELTRRHAKKNSRAKSERLKKEGYLTPAERETQRMEKLREKREKRIKGISEEVKSSESKEKEGRFGHVENANAGESTAHKRNVPSRKYKEFYNDGVYEYSEIEGCKVWSCSMNPDPEFRGSCYRVRNPDAWNWASP